MNKSALLSVCALMALAACDHSRSAMNPDYSIGLVPSRDGYGLAAVPPPCPGWREGNNNDPFENTMMPQLGCATARNLAVAVERPEDLVANDTFVPADGSAASLGVARYRIGKTTPLIDPNATAPAVTQQAQVPGAQP